MNLRKLRQKPRKFLDGETVVITSGGTFPVGEIARVVKGEYSGMENTYLYTLELKNGNMLYAFEHRLEANLPLTKMRNWI